MKLIWKTKWSKKYLSEAKTEDTERILLMHSLFSYKWIRLTFPWKLLSEVCFLEILTLLTEPELPSPILQWLCWSSISSSSLPVVFARKTGCANYSFSPGCNPWLLWHRWTMTNCQVVYEVKRWSISKGSWVSPTLWIRNASLQVGERAQKTGSK